MGKSTRRVSETTPGPSRKGVAAQQNTRGKQKNKAREAQENPCRLASQEKRPQKVQGESQNRAGPRMAPRKNTKKRDARPKRAEQTKAAGHKKKKNQKNRCVCGGVLLLPDLCLSNEKNTQKQKRRRRKNQRTRDRPQKTPDLTSIGFFPDSFGSETPKMKQKHRQKTTKKH